MSCNKSNEVKTVTEMLFEEINHGRRRLIGEDRGDNQQNCRERNPKGGGYEKM